MNDRSFNGIRFLLGAIVLGAGAMYLLDPVSGRRRRARVVEKGLHAQNVALRFVGRKGRHWRNRAVGLGYRLGIVAA